MVPGKPLRLAVASCASVLASGLIACSRSAVAPATGSLSVTIASASGITPNVVITGPGGYNRTLTATQTLTGLSAGAYVVTAVPVTTTGLLVSTVETGAVTETPVTVASGSAATTAVSYGPRPGSGAVWIVGNIDTTTNLAYAFTPEELQGSGVAAPAVILQIPHPATKTGDADAVAFDTAGNLWLGHYQLNTVTEVARSALAKSGVVSEAVTISGNALRATQGLTFDAQGNLWVSNNVAIGQAYTIVEYNAAQLSTSGSPTPMVTIGGPALQGPEQMALDAQGDLWVASSLANTVVEYTPAQLSTGGDLTPSVTLSAADTSLGTPISIAFDHQGNMWVANATVVLGNDAGLSTVVEFPQSALMSSGSPLPTMTITLPGGIPIPWQIAFDNSGDLWVVTSSGHTLLEYTAAQIAGGGSPSPAVTVMLNSLYGGGLAFDPHPSRLPIH